MHHTSNYEENELYPSPNHYSAHLFLSLIWAARYIYDISFSRSPFPQLLVLISCFLTKQLYSLSCLRQGDCSGQGTDESFPVLCSGPRLQVRIWALPDFPDSQQQKAVVAKIKDTAQAAQSFKLSLGWSSCWKSALVMSAGCEGPLLCLTTFLKHCFCLRRVTAFLNFECTTHIFCTTLMPCCIQEELEYRGYNKIPFLLSISEQNHTRCKLKQSLHSPLIFSHLEPKMWQIYKTQSLHMGCSQQRSVH